MNTGNFFLGFRKCSFSLLGVLLVLILSGCPGSVEKLFPLVGVWNVTEVEVKASYKVNNQNTVSRSGKSKNFGNSRTIEFKKDGTVRLLSDTYDYRRQTVNGVEQVFLYKKGNESEGDTYTYSKTENSLTLSGENSVAEYSTAAERKNLFFLAITALGISSSFPQASQATDCTDLRITYYCTK